jgi:hypothetical protein
VDDARVVRRLHASRDLDRQLERLVDAERPLVETILERVALDVFEDEIAPAVLLLEPVDAGDVRMVELRERLRFALEPLEPAGIRRQILRQRLDRDFTIETRIRREVDDAHPTTPDLAVDGVWADMRWV